MARYLLRFLLVIAKKMAYDMVNIGNIYLFYINQLVVMDFSSLSVFSLMKTKMNVISARQEVLAQNIANVDTPGYKAMDIQEPDFKRMLSSQSAGGGQKLKMTATRSGHISGNSGNASAKIVERPKTDERNPNDNNVSVEEEMAKVGYNQMEYQKMLNLYSKTVSMFKIAIGTQGRG